MSIRAIIFAAFVTISLGSCSEDADVIYDEDFESSVIDVLGSERAKSLTGGAQELAVLMDTLSKQYTACWAYFGFSAALAESAETKTLFESKSGAAFDLGMMTVRVGRSDDMAESVMFHRHNIYLRIFRGYYDKEWIQSDWHWFSSVLPGVRQNGYESWDEVRADFNNECESAIEDPAAALTATLRFQATQTD